MKNNEQYENASQDESDHDTAWRERIQRALRDLRSASSDVAERTQRRGPAH
jgi:hypothetical protein